MFEFMNNWDWLFFSALGCFFLLIGYKVLRAGGEAWYKKNGRFMRLSGFVLILASIVRAVLHFAL